MDPQGTIPLAKEDSVLYTTNVAPTTDLSQYADNLVFDSPATYELTSVLRGLTGSGGRELTVRASLSTSDKNVELLIHASTSVIADHTYRIYIDGSVNLLFTQAGVTIYSVPLSIAGSVSISAHWSTRPNPDTTGASDALISEFLVYDHTAVAYVGEITQVTHAVATTNAAWALTVGGWWDGASVTRKSGTVTRCRIGKAWHPAAEWAEDWLSTRTAPTADTYALEPLLPLTVASQIGDDGEWAGQANLGWAAEDNARKRRALWSPLINNVFSDAEAFAKTPDDPVPWVRLAPGSALYEMRIDWLRWVAIPNGCTHARIWVQVVSYVTASTAVPIKLRMYAMNRPEELSALKYPGAPKFAYTFCESALHTVNDTVSGVGQWLSMGVVQLPPYTGNTTGFKDTTHLCLGYAFDPASSSANDANARIKIRTIHARPVFKPAPNNLGE